MKIIRAITSIKFPELLCYGAGLVVFIFLKCWYRETANDELLFLLRPVNGIVSAFSNREFIYESASGFVYPQAGITIDRSCAGFNFWLICFLMFHFQAVASFARYRVLAAPLALLLAYGVTILANASRIGTSLILREMVPGPQLPWLHEAEGAFIFLFFLILFHSAFRVLLSSIPLTYENAPAT